MRPNVAVIYDHTDINGLRSFYSSGTYKLPWHTEKTPGGGDIWVNAHEGSSFWTWQPGYVPPSQWPSPTIYEIDEGAIFLDYAVQNGFSILSFSYGREIYTTIEDPLNPPEDTLSWIDAGTFLIIPASTDNANTFVSLETGCTGFLGGRVLLTHGHDEDGVPPQFCKGPYGDVGEVFMDHQWCSNSVPRYAGALAQVVYEHDADNWNLFDGRAAIRQTAYNFANYGQCLRGRPLEAGETWDSVVAGPDPCLILGGGYGLVDLPSAIDLTTSELLIQPPNDITVVADSPAYNPLIKDQTSDHPTTENYIKCYWSSFLQSSWDKTVVALYASEPTLTTNPGNTTPLSMFETTDPTAIYGELIVPESHNGVPVWVAFYSVDNLGNYSQCEFYCKHQITHNFTPLTETINLDFTIGTGKTIMGDPNGGDRNINPSGSFPNFYKQTVMNIGSADNLVFDSTGLNESLGPGENAEFVYHETSGWKLLWKHSPA